MLSMYALYVTCSGPCPRTRSIVHSDIFFGLPSLHFFMADRERGPIVVRSGIILAVSGTIGTALDTIFAGCIATGPCLPGPPLPIALFVFILGVGVGLLTGGLALRARERNRGGIAPSWVTECDSRGESPGNPSNSDESRKTTSFNGLTA